MWFLSVFAAVLSKLKPVIFSVAWFIPHLHIRLCVQAVVEVKPGGVSVIGLASNPQVEVADPLVQLFCDGHFLWLKPTQVEHAPLFLHLNGRIVSLPEWLPIGV